MKLEERLIVALDFDPMEYGGPQPIRKKVFESARNFEGSGVCVKINSILRASDYDIIDEIHTLGLKVFADLKLVDIPSTMKMDAELLSFYKPDMLTVMCCAGVDGMRIVQKTLPDTNVLGVTVLTSLVEEKCDEIFSCSPKDGVLRFAEMANRADLIGLILSPLEVPFVIADNESYGLELVTPGIRPKWSLVEGDDQSRVMTPAQAIKNGADRIVIGRPITQAKNPREAVMRTLEEIQQGLDQRK